MTIKEWLTASMVALLFFVGSEPASSAGRPFEFVATIPVRIVQDGVTIEPGRYDFHVEETLFGCQMEIAKYTNPDLKVLLVVDAQCSRHPYRGGDVADVSVSHMRQAQVVLIHFETPFMVKPPSMFHAFARLEAAQ